MRTYLYFDRMYSGKVRFNVLPSCLTKNGIKYHVEIIIIKIALIYIVKYYKKNI